MKAIVKPTSSCSYIVPQNGEHIAAFRPSVVSVGEFVNALVMRGKLRVIANDLPEDATDKEFAQFYKDSDHKEDLAVMSFVSKFKPAPAVTVKESVPATPVKAAVFVEQSIKKESK